MVEEFHNSDLAEWGKKKKDDICNEFKLLSLHGCDISHLRCCILIKGFFVIHRIIRISW